MGTYRMCGCFTRKFKIIEAAPPPDVIAAFEKCAEGGPQMTAEQLHRFLVDAQGQGGAKVSDTEEILLQGLQKRHHMAKFRKHALTLDDFHHYLFSANLNLPIDNKASLAFTSLVIAVIRTLFKISWELSLIVDSPSSPPEESLVPYNDDEDDERRALNHIGSREEDGHRVESEEDDEDEDDPYPWS